MGGSPDTIPNAEMMKMHEHHSTYLVDHTEFGARADVRFATINASPTAAAERGSAPPPPALKAVTEAAKDGKVSAAEKGTLFGPTAPGAVKSTIDSEQDRLKKAIAANQAPDIQTKLGTTPNADKLKESVDKLKAADPNSEAAKAQQKNVEARLKDERAVGDLIKDERQLVGTLDAKKAQLQTTLPADAQPGKDGDYQKLRDESAAALKTFNDNHGQVHTSNILEQWNDDKPKTFDELAKQFHDDPALLKDFARVQGRMDNDGGTTDESMNAHIAKLSETDPVGAAQIEARYKAAKQLTAIFTRYNAASGEMTKTQDEIKSIENEQSEQNAKIAEQRKVLSDTVKAEVDKDAVSAAIPASAPSDLEKEKSVPAAQDPANQPPAETPGSTDSQVMRDQLRERGVGITSDLQKEKEAEAAKQAQEAPAKVLDAAIKQGKLPEGATFDDKGTATYTVQPGDSIWDIATRANGGQFDQGLYDQMMQANLERLGRQDTPDLLLPGDVLVIPGRSAADLKGLVHG